MTNLSEKDLVVLKRNDVNDRNVIDPEYDANLYLDSYNKLFVFNIPTQTWKESYLNGEEEVMQRLKPIEKPMKEYLYKNTLTNKFELITPDLSESPKSFIDQLIEVPEGATFYAEDSNMGEKGEWFFKLNDGEGAIWLEKRWMRSNFNVDNMRVLWIRAAKPEELPFIDDEPKGINKGLQGLAQAVSALSEKMKNKSIGFGDHELTGLPTSELPNIKYMNSSAMGKTESLNDTYAEIEKVRQSAWSKQEGGSHYKKLAIQPMQYALANKLDYAQANVVKYVTRHADKNGKDDLLKAIHNIELMIEHYYPK